jgi:dihydrolipoamide dehydrogenase
MNYELIVIGAGPAGYPAAAIGVKQGLKTLLIEARELGGTCLNRGCIPTKSFCRSAESALEIGRSAEFGVNVADSAISVDIKRVVERKNEIVAQLREAVTAVVSGADIKQGKARFISNDTVEVEGEQFTAPKIVIATGSTPAILPIPGAELCLTSNEILDTENIPQSMAIIGGGVIGLEFASIFSAFGCEVTVVEFCKEILPGFDRDIAKRLRTALTKRGVKFLVGAGAEAVEKDAESGFLKVKYNQKNRPGELVAEQVLMAVGRRAVVPEGAAEIGIEVGRKGIVVDENFMTSVAGIYAIGDCNGLCQLAHAATAQARRMMGLANDLSPIPAAVFTVPEVAASGLTEEQAEQQNLSFRVVKLPIRSNGKALTLGETEGLVKMVISVPETASENAANSASENGEKSAANKPKILGCHILGPHASDLIMEASLAISAGLSVDAIQQAIHPHPTLSELLPSALK